MTPSEQHLEQQRLERRAAFVEKALLASIQGGGFIAWRSRLWSSNTIGYERATMQEWAKHIEAEALVGFDVIEKNRTEIRK